MDELEKRIAYLEALIEKLECYLNISISEECRNYVRKGYYGKYL